MAYSNPVELVEAFWNEVWNTGNTDKVDDFVVEDVVITNAGQDIHGRENFKAWIRDFREKIDEFRIVPIETFQNHDGSRVVSRWEVRGKNNGILNTAPDRREISFTGTAVWAVSEDGKLLHNWVERASWELFQQLNQPAEESEPSMVS
jgi:steroid delta-isomerase-like uncharacterized protein